jgi:hypothetical protein
MALARRFRLGEARNATGMRCQGLGGRGIWMFALERHRRVRGGMYRCSNGSRVPRLVLVRHMGGRSTEAEIGIAETIGAV